MTIQSRALSTRIDNQSPPREFRVFRAGVNRTAKGDVLFDSKAAAAVMAAYRAHGVDLAIDLEHMSLDDPNASPRADTTDARGWFQLELRGGELWAVNVRWTPDGERRLREKTQRYISPAFRHDDEGRPTELINAALTSMPATHGAQQLVAASYGRKTSAIVATRLPRGEIAALRARAEKGWHHAGRYLEICPKAEFRKDAKRADCRRSICPWIAG